MNIDTNDNPSCVETLMVAAHRDRNALYARRRMLVLRGIDQSHLPDDISLMAFALLGNYEREALVAELRSHWENLQAKGLVSGGIDTFSTAELRLFAQALEQFEAIEPAWQRLRETVDASEPPLEIWNSARRLSGLWGDSMSLPFSVRDVSHILIDPDRVFGVQSAFLTSDPDLVHTGSFMIPIDNGDITVSLLHRTGELYRLAVKVSVEEWG